MSRAKRNIKVILATSHLVKTFGFTDSLLICQDYRGELRLTYEDNLFPRGLMVATNISYQKVGTKKKGS